MVDITILPVLGAKLTEGKAGRGISGEKERVRWIDNHCNHRIIWRGGAEQGPMG